MYCLPWWCVDAIWRFLMWLCFWMCAFGPWRDRVSSTKDNFSFGGLKLVCFAAVIYHDWRQMRVGLGFSSWLFLVGITQIPDPSSIHPHTHTHTIDFCLPTTFLNITSFSFNSRYFSTVPHFQPSSAPTVAWPLLLKHASVPSWQPLLQVEPLPLSSLPPSAWLFH